mmetsp:Transcript_20642/g.61775  ORF Transcript_20642/g.61775 Transcript_20642/m.61775 type:complete len:201 (-) Transcript_20642:167-769(-)
MAQAFVGDKRRCAVYLFATVIFVDLPLFLTQSDPGHDLYMAILACLFFKALPLAFWLRDWLSPPPTSACPGCESPGARAANFQHACSVAPCTRRPQLEDAASREARGYDLEAPGEADESDGVLCAICLEPVVAPQLCGTLRCGHEFHATCVEQWWRVAPGDPGRSPACPVCRRSSSATPAPALPPRAAAAAASVAIATVW